MVVAAINYGDVDGKMPKSSRGVETAKPRSYDDYPGPARCLQRFR
jgi:hypothetical protein